MLAFPNCVLLFSDYWKQSEYEETLSFLLIPITWLLLPELRTKATAITDIEWDITDWRAFEGGPEDLIIIYEMILVGEHVLISKELYNAYL